jgi:two-component system chemotaxis response regulator CheY
MVKIMTVDDSKLMNAVIANFIKKENKDYEIIAAVSGEDAVEKYKKERPDLVFMDIKMPGMDGLEATEQIMKINHNAKIVMCTALKEAEQEQRARALGAVGYITKPFGHDDIVKALKLIGGGP